MSKSAKCSAIITMIFSLTLASCGHPLVAVETTDASFDTSVVSEASSTTRTAKLAEEITTQATSDQTLASTTETIAETITETVSETTTEATRQTTKETTSTIEMTTKATTQQTTKETTTDDTTIVTTTENMASELDGVDPDRLEFTKDMLSIYDNCAESSVFGKFREYLSHEQIINYGRTGEGLSVVNYENGKPAVALVNCNSDVTAAFKKMIDEMEGYDANYLKNLTSNGFVAFMVYRFQSGGSNFNFNKQGLINWNLDPTKIVSSNNLRRAVETECFGIRMYHLGGDYSRYIGFMKELLSSDCWWNLYKKTGDELCYDLSHASYMVALLNYGPAYDPIKFKDDKIQALLRNIRDNNLATPFGGSWVEIGASLADRPDWTE